MAKKRGRRPVKKPVRRTTAAAADTAVDSSKTQAEELEMKSEKPAAEPVTENPQILKESDMSILEKIKAFFGGDKKPTEKPSRDILAETATWAEEQAFLNRMNPDRLAMPGMKVEPRRVFVRSAK